jgi:hypothetical protein
MSIDYYERLRRDIDEGHPVDAAVERQLKQTRAMRKLLRLQTKVMRALGDQRVLFIQASDLVNNMHYDRETAYFNEGYRHGLADGLSRAAHWRLSGEGKAIARDLRRRLIQKRIPPLEALRAVIDALWSTTADSS